VGLASLAVAALTVAGCAETESEPLHPAAEAVDGALEARASRSTDASDYEPYFSDPAVVEALVESARVEETSTPPVPEWETPYVSEETSSSAEVVVVWIPSDEFPDWPAATVFSLTIDEDWFIVDASDVATGPIPPELLLEDE
jgi:hypothetical protein